MKDETPEETMRRLQAHVERRNPNLPIEDVMARATTPPDYRGSAEDFEAERFFHRQRAARKKRNRIIGFASAAVLFLFIIPLVLGAANEARTNNDGGAGSSAVATTDRGAEAKAVVEKFTLPESWKALSKPELTGDDEESYSFYRIEYQPPQDYTGEDLRDWFRETAAISEVRDEAQCTEAMDRSTMECSAQFRAMGEDGYPDYDKPRQTFTARYTNSGGEVRVAVEGYSTS